ncbi:MAG: phosphate/phosphite/phosphonate ABC transporter substrate-binding protein [Pseudomonadota bacterium]
MRPLRALLRLGIACIALAAGDAGAARTYTLAIVPQYTAVDIGMRWAPVIERIRAETGIELQLHTTPSIPAFEAEMLKGIPDFAFMNPYHMVMAAKAQGYRPLVRSTQALSGILVVARNGPAKRLEDLNGATLAMPAPNAFGASLYMRALLSEKERLRYRTAYVGTHQNVYRHVLLGEALAGGGVEATLEKEPAAVREQLAILYRTPGTASHPLAAHPRIPAGDVEQVVAALRSMTHDAAGRALLARVELDDAAPADYARDYAPLLELRLDRYVARKGR